MSVKCNKAGEFERALILIHSYSKTINLVLPNQANDTNFLQMNVSSDYMYKKRVI